MNLEAELRKAEAGSRKMEITFKKEYPSDVQYLIEMQRGGIIEIKNVGILTLTAIMQSKNWGHKVSRTFTVTLTPTFDPIWFLARLKRGLEKAEAV